MTTRTYGSRGNAEDLGDLVDRRLFEVSKDEYALQLRRKRIECLQRAVVLVLDVGEFRRTRDEMCWLLGALEPAAESPCDRPPARGEMVHRDPGEPGRRLTVAPKCGPGSPRHSEDILDCIIGFLA